MPIKPEKKVLYPENWERIALLIKEKAGWRCELCKAAHGEPHPITKSLVVLTVHHINGDPTDNRRINLMALCQRCHNRLDLPFRIHRSKPKAELILEDPRTAPQEFEEAPEASDYPSTSEELARDMNLELDMIARAAIDEGYHLDKKLLAEIRLTIELSRISRGGSE